MRADLLNLLEALGCAAGALFLGEVLERAGLDRVSALNLLREMQESGLVSLEPEGWVITPLGRRIGEGLSIA